MWMVVDVWIVVLRLLNRGRHWVLVVSPRFVSFRSVAVRRALGFRMALLCSWRREICTVTTELGLPRPWRLRSCPLAGASSGGVQSAVSRVQIQTGTHMLHEQCVSRVCIFTASYEATLNDRR